MDPLQRALSRDDHRSVYRACRRAIDKIRTAEGRRAEGGELKREIEELREAHEEMKRGLEKLQGREITARAGPDPITR